ncbi:MAG: hypothetical protein KIH01_05515 [Candidatus Freyarchaeota archaeon]|nr:hypothetical protein [Candidatus Jordarchaeia archaeon]
MGKYVTVSVKVPLEVKRKLEELGIKPSEVLRRAIDEELRRRELEEIERELSGLDAILNKFSKDFVVKSIREDRDSR